MNKFSLFALSCLTLFFASCENAHVSLDDEGTYIIDTTQTVDTIHFQASIYPILQAKCASCHNAETPPNLETPEAYSNLLTGNYINIDDPENSSFFTLDYPGHADDHLSVEEHISIVKWIEQGALNN